MSLVDIFHKENAIDRYLFFNHVLWGVLREKERACKHVDPDFWQKPIGILTDVEQEAGSQASL